LEHVGDPVSFLRDVHSKLKDDGLFILEYPDVDTASNRSIFLPSYFQKSHFYDFSSFNLLPILTKIGFRVEHFGRFSDFPRDKNVLMVCRKGSLEGSSETFNRDKAKELLDRMRKKFEHPKRLLVNENINVLHIASHNINVGDGAISSGIHKAVSAVSMAEVDFHNFDIVDYKHPHKMFTEESLDELGMDLVLVGGGGTIDGHVNRVLNGTALPMDIEAISKIKTPMSFLALGHNLFPTQEFFNTETLQELIEMCSNRGFPFSVRRDGSWERLAELFDSGTMKNVRKVPDPGFFVDVNPRMRLPQIKSGGDGRPFKKYIIIQIALDGYEHRFSFTEEFKEENMFKFLTDIAKFSEHVIASDYEVIFAIHTLNDISPVSSIYFSMEPTAARLGSRISGVAHPSLAGDYFSLYRDASLVVGMRGHSVICGTGLGIPTVAIATHDKVSGYMKELGCSEWAISPGETFLEDLTEMSFDLLENSNDQLARVDNIRSEWRDEFTDFLLDTFRLIQ
jgi:polysaccharide pyruvyl transferase WcaK-like protein